MKILQVIDSYYPAIDGVVNTLDNYTTILNTIDGVECHALVPTYDKIVERGYPTLRCKSIRVNKFGANLPLPSLDIKLKKALKETKYDLIHIHAPVTMGRYILKYAKRHNIPTVLTSHTRYHEEINRSVSIKPLQKIGLDYCIKTMKMADYIWSPSEANGKEAEEMYKLGKTVSVMRNGTDMVDNCTNEILSEVVNQLKQQFDIDTERDNVLLFVGRVVEVKNLSVVLDAMAKLTNTNPNTKLLIVGDGDYRQHLQEQCDKLDINHTVKFAGEIKDRNILTAYYKLANLFVLPSTFDCGSLTISEAAALSLPVMVITGSSSSEGIVDNHNSYLAENDSDKWADKIAEIFQNKQHHEQVKANCHDELYRSWEAVVHNVYEQYKKIIANHNK